MFSRSLQVTRSTAVRALRQHAPSPAARPLTTSAVRQADTVQDMYLKYLREYKPTPPKPGEAEQHVHKFATPSGFQSPEEPNLANELSAYQSQAVEVEGQADAAASGEQQAKANEPDWFEQEEDFAAEEEAAAGGH